MLTESNIYIFTLRTYFNYEIKSQIEIYFFKTLVMTLNHNYYIQSQNYNIKS